ncbi:MAG: pyridoxal phosphate-dependent aminotransferase [Myxococcales bacterium]|nr:pyridoxal phosphate-dependent aminotransferase [Myxococcales bacterium]MCB9525926.1 pyridoxal phosphate-dependent aminotransferase [Myxococcales bacterium]
MPRYPHVSPVVAAMPGRIYSSLAHRMAAHPGETYPLHVGDTYMEPAVGCRMQDLTVADHPGMHRYSSVQGDRALLDAICARTERTQGVPTPRDAVLVTAGATGGLGAVCGALVGLGDEVIILAPFWPLIAGIVHTMGGKPVPVPFFPDADTPITPEAAVKAVEAAITDRTVALYVNTPHNPTGRVIPQPVLAALAELTRKHDLWLLADEVYEHYVYRGEHAYTRPLAPERTFSNHSFSKAYGMAGNRCGYVVGPPEVMPELRKVSTHVWYSTPTASQIAAYNALQGPGDAWAAKARDLYADVGARAAARLGVPAPEGSTFLFLDVADALDDRGVDGLLSDCVDQGLLVGPGESFGPYPTHVRLCFTSVEPERALRGVDVLARCLGR